MKNTSLPSKKRYAKPKLTTYGKLSEIGQGSGSKGMFFSETGGASQQGTMV